MKKLFALLLTLAMVLSLAACGQAPAADPTDAPAATPTDAPAAPAEQLLRLLHARVLPCRDRRGDSVWYPDGWTWLLLWFLIRTECLLRRGGSRGWLRRDRRP